jgi:tetratricopeptide (TPR) repeat protein
MSSGNTEEALSKYEKTISLNNKNFAVWEQLMYGYLELENYSSLLTLSNKALDLYPNQSINFYFNAIANIKSKNFKDAISIAEEGMIVSGGNKIQQSKLKTAIALAYLSNNEKDKAQKLIDEAISLNDKNSSAYEVLGDINESMGDISKAKENWKKSISLGNKSKRLIGKIL